MRSPDVTETGARDRSDAAALSLRVIWSGFDSISGLTEQ